MKAPECHISKDQLIDNTFHLLDTFEHMMKALSRPSQKSTCIHSINIRVLCGVNFVTRPPQFRSHKTLVLHRVNVMSSAKTL